MKQDLTFVHNSFVKFQNPYICLMTLGWENCKPSHSCTAVPDTYMIHFVQSGKGTLLLNDKMYHIKTNDVFLVRPNQKAKYTADEKEPWHYSYFSFAGVLAAGLLEETVFKNNNSVFTMPDDSIIGIIDEGLTAVRESKSVSICTLEYLAKLLSALVIEPIYVKDDQNLLITQIDQYIKQNYMKDIQISEIADAFNISRNYLFRVLKKNKGISLKSYLSNIRIQEAKSMLITTDMPITQISEMLGFKTYSAFFKMFKAATNSTPKEYRAVKKNTNENKSVFKSANGIYQIESETDSVVFKEKYDTKI